MVKQSTGESDETRLKQKIAARMNEEESTGGPALRSLRKRLKRVQRRRRAVSSRKKQAAGKSAETKT